MTQKVKTIFDFLNEGKIINLPDGINQQDAATVAQLLSILGVIGETPSGTIDGINTTFTTAFNFLSNRTRVYYNGVRQNRGITNDYTEQNNNEIVFNSPPKKGIVTVDYIKA